jgi:hypothetical protein
VKHATKFRISIPAVTLQIFSIIFSILLALSVNEWKEARGRKEVANKSLENFRREIETNRDAIEKSLRDQKSVMNLLDRSLKEMHKKEEKLSVSVPSIDLPDVTTTTWETAMATNALAHLDYAVIQKLSGIYLQQKWLMSLEDKVFTTILASSSYDEENVEGLTMSLYTGLKNIVRVESALLELYDETLPMLRGLPA